MATLAPSSSPSSPSRRRKKSWARRCERFCWAILTSFPLAFVYGLTTWAVWVQATIGFSELKGTWTGHTSAFIGIAFWALLNWSYTVAVFTDPGSTTTHRKGYSSLPSHEAAAPSSITAKSTGETRFCKKCQQRKPDRAHHCSSCKRCVLKMDHHCPWLATCVGFRNYKPFVLFLMYTCFLCYTCFAVSATWVWGQVVSGGDFDAGARILPVNYILLTVLSGIIGLVLTGFTGWHLYLATQGQTTIESLEKTRYLTPVRNSMQKQLSRERHYVGREDPQSPKLADQIREFHANALPGVTRPEEGEEDQDRPTSAQQSLRQNYSDIEAQREHDRYAAYLDERDSEKLPNAFDHGWKRNVKHVFGESPLLWPFPIINTTGDGWNWEVSPKWIEAREELAKERQAREREDRAFEQADRGWVQQARTVGPRNDSAMHYNYQQYTDSVPKSDVSMQTLASRNNSRPTSSHTPDEAQYKDSERDTRRQHLRPEHATQSRGDWNDIPEDMLPSRGSSRTSMRTRSPRPTRPLEQG